MYKVVFKNTCSNIHMNIHVEYLLHFCFCNPSADRFTVQWDNVLHADHLEGRCQINIKCGMLSVRSKCEVLSYLHYLHTFHCYCKLPLPNLVN